MSTHSPHTYIHKSLLQLSVRFYREALFLLFQWDEPAADTLPTSIGDLAFRQRRVNYYCVYLNVPAPWAQGNIQDRGRRCEVSEDGRVLPTVIRVNTFLTGIYPQIIQSAVFSKKALIHTVLHLLKLIPHSRSSTRGTLLLASALLIVFAVIWRMTSDITVTNCIFNIFVVYNLHPFSVQILQLDYFNLLVFSIFWGREKTGGYGND